MRNKKDNIVYLIEENDSYNDLSLNKPYEIITQSAYYIYILNDHGVLIKVSPYYFLTYSKWLKMNRSKKLNKLLK